MAKCNVCNKEVDKHTQSYRLIGYGTGIVHMFCIIPKTVKAIWSKKSLKQGE